MPDEIQTAEIKPEAGSAADFAQLDEGEVRSTPEKPIAAPVTVQADDDEGEAVTTDDAEQGTEADPYAEPPEFWSKERKELYARVTDPEVRAAIHEQEKERVRETAKKIEAATLSSKTHTEKAAQLEQEREQLVGWWKDTGPKLAEAFKSKWDRVDWNDLAANNQAEYVRLTHERNADFALFQQTAEKHAGEVQKANKRAADAMQESRAAEHKKLAEKLPEHFGKPDVAQKTYDELRDFLIGRGVPAERITNIYEEAVVGIALDAMLYQKAQKAAKEAKATTLTSSTATQTPRRITPGAGTRTGQPTETNAYRQARERLNNGENLSREDAARLFS